LFCRHIHRLALFEGQKENKIKEGMVEKMRKMMKAVLVLMAILTAVYVSAVVYANVNANDDYYIHPYLTSEYVDTPPTEWYTPEELGIVRTFWCGNCLEIWVDQRKEPFQLEEEKPIFLYEGKFYQVVTKGHIYVLYTAYKHEQDTPPTEWYTPEELGIVEVWELGNRAVQIVVDRRKEPFPFGPLGTDDQLTVFLYKDEFYTVSHRWVTFAIGRGSLPPWQTPIGGVLGVGWVFTGALFVKERKKK
jgi:hypothetical protein